jgi:hypothetical protein
VGGGRRILGVFRDEASCGHWLPRLQDAFGHCVTVQTYAHGGPLLCCEAEGISFDAVLARLKSPNPNLAEMASRIHTRADIQW